MVCTAGDVFLFRPRSKLRGHLCAQHLFVGANRALRGGAEEQLRYKHIPQFGFVSVVVGGGFIGGDTCIAGGPVGRYAQGMFGR